VSTCRPSHGLYTQLHLISLRPCQFDILTSVSVHMACHRRAYISTDLGVDSSSHVPFRARTDIHTRDTQTNRYTSHECNWSSYPCGCCLVYYYNLSSLYGAYSKGLLAVIYRTKERPIFFARACESQLSISSPVSSRVSMLKHYLFHHYYPIYFKFSLAMPRSGLRCKKWFPGPTGVTILNGTSIELAVLQVSRSWL